MRFFDKQTSIWILILCLPLLFLPKINLLSLSDRESAGVRIDDIVLLLLALVMIWGHLALHQRLRKVEFWVLALVGFSLLSFFLNRLFVSLGLLDVNASVYYSLRLFEYFLFFYVGVFTAQFLNASNIVKALFLWNLLLMLLQKMEWIGQFSVTGFIPMASDRVAGIASFPSEAGLLLNMIFCYLVFGKKEAKQTTRIASPFFNAFIEKTYVYWLFLICATFVIFTGSRIAIFSLVIAFAFRIKEELAKGSIALWLIALLFASVAAVVMIGAILNTQSIFMRSSDLLSFRNIDLIAKVWDHIDLVDDPIGRESISNNNYDTSWWMRIHKWCYALKIYYLHPECYLQGVGPGFAMAALDGGFLRILTENGLIGCVIFWKIFSYIYHESKQLKWMVIVLLINMIFFDAYLAYKPMSLLFFISGYSYCTTAALIPRTLDRHGLTEHVNIALRK